MWIQLKNLDFNLKKKYPHIKLISLKAKLFSIVFLFCTISFSQNLSVPKTITSPLKKGKNLIPNPSFETHKNKASDIKNALPWIGVGTVDYYMKPDKRDSSRYKGARTGASYAGLRFQADYKEYMHVKLLDELQKGRVYNFKMYVRLLEANNVTVTVKQLGAYFSNAPFSVGMTFDEEGLVDSTYSKGISGTLNWILIQGDYTAQGGEKYIIIGNFRTKMKNDFVKKKKVGIFDFKEAYYYIDDISLRKLIMPGDTAGAPKFVETKIPPIIPDNISIGEVYPIPNLEFEKDNAKLKNASIKILEVVVHDLNEHPFIEIEINGYTDNKANEAVNRKLSKDRAKVVYDYLKANGIVSPMSYNGFGPAKPIAPNDTEENRAKNRRIEIVIKSD